MTSAPDGDLRRRERSVFDVYAYAVDEYAEATPVDGHSRRLNDVARHRNRHATDSTLHRAKEFVACLPTTRLP
jgi:hypothetical protein